MHGIGCFFFGSGKVEYSNYFNGEITGKSIRWSADRRTAWLMEHGKRQQNIDLGAACKIAESMGHPRDPPPAANGLATYRYPDGSAYHGEVVHGVIHGNGTYVFPSGSRYVGQFEANRKNGIGIMHYVDGNTFEGQFREDMKEGGGVFKYAGGDHYVGDFRADHRDGFGFYWYADAAISCNYYQAGMPRGQGVWWSGDRMKAARLQDGRLVQQLGLGEALALSVKLKFPTVPPAEEYPGPKENVFDFQGSRSLVLSDKSDKTQARSPKALPPPFSEEVMPHLPPPSSVPQQAFQTEAPTMETGIVVFGLAPE